MANSCLSYMRARYYDPEIGRFTTEDPIGFKGGTVNLYEYVKNNPVNYNDPSGLFGRGRNLGDVYKGHSDFTGWPRFDWVSEDYGWTSWYNYPIGTCRHFRELNSILEDIDTAIRSCDKCNFESYMHQAQDFFSHYAYGYRCLTFGHLFDGKLPDQNEIAWGYANNFTSTAVAEWDKCCKQ